MARLARLARVCFLASVVAKWRPAFMSASVCVAQSLASVFRAKVADWSGRPLRRTLTCHAGLPSEPWRSVMVAIAAFLETRLALRTRRQPGTRLAGFRELR